MVHHRPTSELPPDNRPRQPVVASESAPSSDGLTEGRGSRPFARKESGKLEQFQAKKYLSLETYRKTGAAVATPVWFAEEDDRLYVYSLANAGKVKRIRNNPRVRIAPCSARGVVRGPWVDAEARIVEGREEEHGHKLLNRKYWLKSVGDLFSKLMNRKRSVIVIRPR